MSPHLALCISGPLYSLHAILSQGFYAVNLQPLKESVGTVGKPEDPFTMVM